MNFLIKEDGKRWFITIISGKGTSAEIDLKGRVIKFPYRFWKKLLAQNKGGKIEITVFNKDDKKNIIRYEPFDMYIANEPVDPYICYRLLYPGYESWSEIQIMQRCTENFGESAILENQMLDNNCINCHTFLKNDPSRFLLHVRGSKKGTYFVNGKHVTRKNLRTENMIANAVYPALHPSGRVFVFSSNEIAQAYHMQSDRNIEVFDMSARLVRYDPEKDQISAIKSADTIKYMETFPCWSPDGKYLYYCRTRQIKKNFDYKSIKYDLVRRTFDEPSGSFGVEETMICSDSINKSVSLPAVSPDGNYLIVTITGYGTFPIWHKEADLYLYNLKNGTLDSLDLNSDETESHHSWSSNSMFLVFSSKRGDGLTARPYIAYFYSPDSIGKPFVLPQKDPALYNRMIKTFNRPEFVSGRIRVTTRDFARASGKEADPAKWQEPPDQD